MKSIGRARWLRALVRPLHSLPIMPLVSYTSKSA